MWGKKFDYLSVLLKMKRKSLEPNKENEPLRHKLSLYRQFIEEVKHPQRLDETIDKIKNQLIEEGIYYEKESIENKK